MLAVVAVVADKVAASISVQHVDVDEGCTLRPKVLSRSSFSHCLEVYYHVTTMSLNAANEAQETKPTIADTKQRCTDQRLLQQLDRQYLS